MPRLASEPDCRVLLVLLLVLPPLPLLPLLRCLLPVGGISGLRACCCCCFCLFDGCCVSRCLAPLLLLRGSPDPALYKARHPSTLSVSLISLSLSLSVCLTPASQPACQAASQPASQMCQGQLPALARSSWPPPVSPLVSLPTMSWGGKTQ